MASEITRSQAFVKVTTAYIVAFAVAVASLYALGRSGDHSLIIQVMLADVAATLAIFAYSVRFQNSSFYDAYWSVIPMWLAPYLVYVGWDSGADRTRSILAAILVLAWGARLTHNWARGWTGLDHEDWRYVRLQQQTGKFYWLVSFLGIHMFPTFQVFLGCLPLFFVMTEPNAALGWLDGVAVLVTATGIAFEFFADNQLRDWVLHRKQPGQTMTEGLWGWSRHPNYFGELSFWAGIWLFGVAAVGFEPWWLVSGVAALGLMFHFISIPMIEKRMLDRRSDYEQIQRRISRLIPWFPKRV